MTRVRTEASARDFLTAPARTRGPYGLLRVAGVLLALAAACGVAIAIVATPLAMVTLGDDVSPAPALAVLQLAAIAVCAPVVIVVARVAFRMRLGDLVSAGQGIRWPLLAQATAISLVGLGAYTVIRIAAGSEELVPLTGAVAAAIAVAVLLVPVQALAEELLFRAFGPQVVHGSIGTGRVGAVVTAAVSSALFASLHAAGNVVTWLSFFAFGLVFAALVWATAGIEAAVALHAVNNVLFVVAALVTGQDLAASSDVRVDAAVLAQLGVFTAVAVVIALLARRRAARAGSAA